MNASESPVPTVGERRVLRTQAATIPPVATKTLIDGVWSDGERFDVLDKFTATTVATFVGASREDVERSVSVADRAAAAGPLPPATRAAILRRAADLIEQRRADFCALMAAEAGFTVSDSTTEIDRAVSTIRLCAEEATRIGGQMVAFGATPGHEGRTGFTVRGPVGIVCCITPFNSPLNVVLHKVGPALAAGNAVILKPSPLAPLSSALLCEVLLEAGLPSALIALVCAEGADVGKWLVADQRIGFYAFTGSTAVGRAIAAGAGLRRTQLELGSIASTIVCGDADLERAMPRIANAAFRKAGQVCTSVQRLYVHRDVWPEAVSALASEASRCIAGDPLDADVQIGPLVSRLAADRVQNWVQQAESAGASIRAGGTRYGSVIDPTVLTGVPVDQPVLTRELFGPVISVVPFDDLDEAITGANDTPFGLSCGFYTTSMRNAEQAIRRLRFGSVHINEPSSSRADEMPFGGLKDSGHGHEGPKYAILEMTEERLITLNPLARA